MLVAQVSGRPGSMASPGASVTTQRCPHDLDSSGAGSPGDTGGSRVTPVGGDDVSLHPVPGKLSCLFCHICRARGASGGCVSWSRGCSLDFGPGVPREAKGIDLVNNETRIFSYRFFAVSQPLSLSPTPLLS